MLGDSVRGLPLEELPRRLGLRTMTPGPLSFFLFAAACGPASPGGPSASSGPSDSGAAPASATAELSTVAARRKTVTADPCAIVNPKLVSCLREEGNNAQLAVWQRLGDDIAAEEHFVHLEGTGEQVCALLEPSGRILCWSTRRPEGVRGEHHLATATAEPMAGAVDFDLVGDSVCALDAEGRVSCWGDNGWGQLGDGTRESRDTPRVVDLPAPALDVEAGGGSVCALLESREVHCWGENGTQGDAKRLKPEPIRGLSAVRSLESNRRAALVGGGWATWKVVDQLPEHGFSEAARVPTAEERFGDDCRFDDGVVTCPVNDTEAPMRFEPATEFDEHHRGWCMRKVDDSVWCAGAHIPLHSPPPEVAFDQATRVPGLGAVTHVASMADAVCAIHDQGALSCWGRGDHLPHRPRQRDGFLGTPTRVPLPGPATDVVVDTGGACAIAQGKAFCWGPRGSAWELGAATGLRRLAGRPCAETPEGLRCLDASHSRAEQMRTVVPPSFDLPPYSRRCTRVRPRLECEWGSEDLECPSEPKAPCKVVFGTDPRPLKFDRALSVSPRDRLLVGGGGVCTLQPGGVFNCSSAGAGLASYRNFDIQDIPNIAAAEVGFRSVCAIDRGGALLCWSEDARMGEPGRKIELGIDDAAAVEMGDLGGYVVRKDGSLWSWGANDHGQRGLGGEGWTVSDVPIRMELLSPGARPPQGLE